MKIPAVHFEAYAIVMLLIALGLLVWTAVQQTLVVGAVLNAVGEDGTGWILALLAGLFAHVAAWTVVVVPVRYMSDKPTLAQEIRNLPGEIRKAFNREQEQRARLEAAPDSPERRRYWRRLGLAGLVVGAILCAGVFAGALITGRWLYMLGGLGAAVLVTGLWMSVTGRPVGRS